MAIHKLTILFGVASTVIMLTVSYLAVADYEQRHEAAVLKR
jgi:hypothetical protein